MKIRLKIREHIRRTPIEDWKNNIFLACCWCKKFFFTQAGNENESEKQTLRRKEQSRQDAKQWAANEKTTSLKSGDEEFIKPDGNTTSYYSNGIKANVRMRVEQDVDLVLKNLILKILGRPCDEVLLTTDRRHEHYKANQYRIILKDTLLFQKRYRKTSSIK